MPSSLKRAALFLGALSLWGACTPEPRAPELLVGTFTMFNRESPFLIAAPHGEFDTHSGDLVYEFCEHVRWDCLIAEGFRDDAAIINVNRPTEGMRLAEARFTERATVVYAKYVKRIRRLSPRVRFYVEIHGHDNAKLGETIDIATTGLSAAQAQAIQESFVRELNATGLSHLAVRVDVLEAIRYKATHAREFGVLSFISPAIHVELPSQARDTHFEQLVQVLTRALPEAALAAVATPEVSPAPSPAAVAPHPPPTPPE